jgi:predicted transcriptional regulator YheO
MMTTGWKTIQLLVLASFMGCSTNSEPKMSLFEHDHEVAAHWPSDLSDVAVKLRERLSSEDANEQIMLEIEELVSWTAEVAADTNLSESDWLPLYHATESLTANMRSSKGTLTDENRKQLELLCQLVDDTAGKIPEQLPNLSKGET